TKLSAEEIDAIVAVSIDEIKDLSGLENHKYCPPLVEILEKDQRYGLLESLFQIAASDGNVEDNESEEIRLITTGLNLEHKHYISARATVLEFLGALRS
ncbi:MAG: putative tellurite resistance protein B-like protein, partial [Bacteriovoracaceae bacterium]